MPIAMSTFRMLPTARELLNITINPRLAVMVWRRRLHRFSPPESPQVTSMGKARLYLMDGGRVCLNGPFRSEGQG